MPRKEREYNFKDYNDRLEEQRDEQLEDQMVDQMAEANAMDALQRIGDAERTFADRDRFKIRYWRNESRLEVWDDQTGSSTNTESFRLNNADLDFLVERGLVEFVELPDGRDPEEVHLTPAGEEAYSEA
jgi:hypothetical protein